MGRTISQKAFDALVAENVEDLGMDPDEALQDALQTLTLQGVDLSGIIKSVPGSASTGDNPVIRALDRLKGLASAEIDADPDAAIELLDRLHDLCRDEAAPDNASVAVKNGGVELLIGICAAIDVGLERALVPALRALNDLLRDIQSTETFRQSGGPKIVVDILKRSSQNSNLSNSGFAVVAAAATGNEVVKELFMDLKVDELLIQTMKEHRNSSIQSLYDAICVLLAPDDNRVLASQVYGYARRLAEIGVADALLDALREGITSSCLVSACIALKAVAVNDEICRSVYDKGGIDVILQCIDTSCEYNNKEVARASCSLLSKLAGSDANKSAIVQKGGLDRLIKLSSKFSDDPFMLQEVMSVISVISLRSPENAARAIEAGAGDMAIQAMQKFPAAYQMQRQSCHMIRNLVARNPENRSILLSNGIEKIIRKAKRSHESCKNAATDALRDLGLDDYNT